MIHAETMTLEERGKVRAPKSAADATPLRVVFLDQSGQLGGAELMLLDLIPQLGIESEVLLLEDGPFRQALEARDIPVRVIGAEAALQRRITKRAGLGSLLRAIPSAWSLTSRLVEAIQGADLLYANTPKAWVLGAIAARRAGVPLLCHLHDIVSARHFSTANRWLLVLSARSAARAVISNSAASARAFVQAGGNSAHVVVIPNGFDLASFDDEWAARYRTAAPLRSTLGMGKASMAVLVGRLTPWKGQHVFMEAVAQTPGLHGVIVGEALFTEEDRAYARSLPMLAASLGCADRIHFLGFRDDVKMILRDADMVVHCSVEPEPFGRVIVEAMLCEKPVIASGEGGAAEIVEDGVTGLLHLAGDAIDLARCLRRLLDDPSAARSMARAGSLAARERYALTYASDKTLQLIRAAVAGGCSRTMSQE